jgi:hypothetical protein
LEEVRASGEEVRAVTGRTDRPSLHVRLKSVHAKHAAAFLQLDTTVAADVELCAHFEKLGARGRGADRPPRCQLPASAHHHRVAGLNSTRGLEFDLVKG